MKLARFAHAGQIKYGVVEEENGAEYLRELPNGPFGELRPAGGRIPMAQVMLLAPCTPTKIVAVGLNYVDHARELGMAIPEEPVIFMKPLSTLVGPGGLIIYPAMSRRVEYEGELAIVIKDTTRDVRPEEAKAHILGYSCYNDVTARDLQQKDVQWTRAKSFNTFGPLGPIITDEIDPDNAPITLLVNGQKRQSSSTNNFIFPVARVVSFISQIMPLYPGDVIATGTPPGVGELKPGDEVEVFIEGIGRLRNQVAA
ncbi:MAG: fumarylacetoacetate hydrolase family protein [Firmicutes bacterium]|nr:fumarylacetoacetate hydrolase family protein [Bacillota bacterium]